MKRDPALVSLSHDHHQALVVAHVLRQASPASVHEARTEFLTYWNEQGRAHFRAEEEILLPAYAGHGDAHHPLVAHALCDHVAIRHDADELARDRDPVVTALHQLGGHLADHVRFEERELFPLIERTLPAAQLAAVAVALEQVPDPR